MTNNQNEKHVGRIKMFNRQFGFIEYAGGDIYFHKSDIINDNKLDIGNVVSFLKVNSTKKKGRFQASNVNLYSAKELSDDKFESIRNSIFGEILWYDDRGYGVISSQNQEYFFRDEQLNNKNKYNQIIKGLKCIFNPNIASYNYKTIDVLIIPDSIFESLKDTVCEKDKFIETIVSELLSKEKIDKISAFGETYQLLYILVHLMYDITQIIEKLYSISSSDIKFLFWYNNFTKKIELNFIIGVICDSYGQKLILLGIRERRGWSEYESFEPYRNQILNKILIQEKHDVVLNHLLNKCETITSNSKKYELVTLISTLKLITDEEKEQFCNLAYIKCDDECKFRMWKDGLYKEKDIKIIAKNLSYSIPDFIEYFINATDEEKFYLLKVALIKLSYKIKELLSQEQIVSFVNSHFFDEQIKKCKLHEDYLLIWYFKQELFNTLNVVNTFSPEEFVKIINMFPERNNIISKVYQIYSELPISFQVQLWISSIIGELDYIKFSQVFHLLSNDDKKLFNKKVKATAKDKQISTFLSQVPKAIILNKDANVTKYKCKWRNIYWRNKSIQIFLNSEESTNEFPCTFSKTELNLLTQEYFTNRRIDDIIVDIDNSNNIKRIEGLDSIETQIVFAEVRKNVEIGIRHNVSNEEIVRLIHNIAERNKCIQFLNKQETPFNVVDIQELVTEVYGGLKKDISFLYCIPDNDKNVYLIWESVEFEKSKATHIFKCKFDDVDNYVNLIKDFLETTIYSRTILNSSEKDDVEIKNRLNYFGRINHDSKDYFVWELRIKELLPFLK